MKETMPKIKVSTLLNGKKIYAHHAHKANIQDKALTESNNIKTVSSENKELNRYLFKKDTELANRHI